ncbi:MAG: hemolysin family protein [Candidatus Omnitrophica bacterium]|nr:hemolysin family protein [Candidatus Omnitrophota bacterium]
MLNLFLIIIFTLFSAFFSASETAIFSLSNLKLRKLQAKNINAYHVLYLIKKPTQTLSTIVFGNMLVNIGLSSLLTTIFVPILGKKGLFVSIIVSGLIVLFLGEIFPKTISIYLSEKVSLFSAKFLRFFLIIFLPFIASFEKIANTISNVFIRHPKKIILTEEELKVALLLGKKEGYISSQEENMIKHILEFKDTQAKEIITARTDIVAIDNKNTNIEVLEVLSQIKHSKIPVYEGSIDNIIGILHAKDVFLNQNTDYHFFIREPIFVPETIRLDRLLKIFFEKKERMAIVLDEFGGTKGIVTQEDIEEELFGEIYDEFETPKPFIQRIEKNSYKVDAKISLRKLNLELNLKLPKEADTLAGFLLNRFQYIPVQGEKITYQNIEFIIDKSNKKQIISVIVKIK